LSIARSNNAIKKFPLKGMIVYEGKTFGKENLRQMQGYQTQGTNHGNL